MTRLDVKVNPRPAMAYPQIRLHDLWAAGRHLIAKAYTSIEEPDRAVNEYLALALVEPLDIAPRPVFFDPSAGAVVVYAYLDGEMWDRRVPSATQLHALADMWIRLHCLPTNGVWLARGQACGHVTVEELRHYRDEGVLTVEMEAAGRDNRA